MFKVVSEPRDLLKVYCVRSIVFVEEQNCPFELEFDEWETTALHVLGEEQGEPFACARIRFLADYAKLERIAMRKGYRGRGLGHALVDFMIGVARAHGYRRYKMHAQAHLADFYREHGFEAHGEIFEEAGIDHRLMTRYDPT